MVIWAESDIENIISIYPNPCNEKLVIESYEYQNTLVEIFNIQGQLVQSVLLQSFQTILPISQLAKGVYLVQVKNKKGVMVKKIVKN